jgi:hypothetical protein
LPAGFGLNTRSGERSAGIRIASDLHNPWWSTINLLHRAVARTEREFDDSEQVQCSLARAGRLGNLIRRTRARLTSWPANRRESCPAL